MVEGDFFASVCAVHDPSRYLYTSIRVLKTLQHSSLSVFLVDRHNANPMKRVIVGSKPCGSEYSNIIVMYDSNTGDVH